MRAKHSLCFDNRRINDEDLAKIINLSHPVAAATVNSKVTILLLFKK